MKKLILMYVAMSCLLACSGQEEAATKDAQKQWQQYCKMFFANRKPLPPNAAIPACQINGHDCWEVVQNIGNASELKKMGLSVVSIGHPGSSTRADEQIALPESDVPDTSYRLSNGVSILIMCPNSEFTDITITFPNREWYVFNGKKELIDYMQAPIECDINGDSCAYTVKALNQIFTSMFAPIEPLAPGKAEKIQDLPLPPMKMEVKFCGEEVCPIESSLRFDHQFLNILPEKTHQTGNTYTYLLEDGRTLVFNWEPNDPEHGFLTVINTDGTKIKFDPQGYYIK